MTMLLTLLLIASKEEEAAEEERLKKEQQDAEDIEYMRYLLGNIMENIGYPTKTGTMFYVPMSDEEYNITTHSSQGIMMKVIMRMGVGRVRQPRGR